MTLESITLQLALSLGVFHYQIGTNEDGVLCYSNSNPLFDKCLYLNLNICNPPFSGVKERQVFRQLKKLKSNGLYSTKQKDKRKSVTINPVHISTDKKHHYYVFKHCRYPVSSETFHCTLS